MYSHIHTHTHTHEPTYRMLKVLWRSWCTRCSVPSTIHCCVVSSWSATPEIRPVWWNAGAVYTTDRQHRIRELNAQLVSPVKHLTHALALPSSPAAICTSRGDASAPHCVTRRAAHTHSHLADECGAVVSVITQAHEHHVASLHQGRAGAVHDVQLEPCGLHHPPTAQRTTSTRSATSPPHTSEAARCAAPVTRTRTSTASTPPACRRRT